MLVASSTRSSSRESSLPGTFTLPPNLRWSRLVFRKMLWNRGLTNITKERADELRKSVDVHRRRTHLLTTPMEPG